jgi:nitrite reductase/ring-hydroxylating ferredoxin subunit
MYSNITAEATGRALPTRLYTMTDDAGMKDMLSFLIARATMHQQQWLAVLAELQEQGDVLPIPNSFPQSLENQVVNYLFLSTHIDPNAPIPQGRWSQAMSLDGKAQLSAGRAMPAVLNVCPHEVAPVCLGGVRGTALASMPGEYTWGREGVILACPWHGWEFDLLTGRAPLMSAGGYAFILLWFERIQCTFSCEVVWRLISHVSTYRVHSPIFTCRAPVLGMAHGNASVLNDDR